MNTKLILLVCICVISFNGCALPHRKVELPSNDQFSREQLRIFSDIKLPRRHRLLDELTARRRDITSKLLLPMSDEPINVYIFDDSNRFKQYLKLNHPSFPDRRAFFVKNDTDLKVFAHWGEKVAEDLRHEVSHGYLHSVIPSIPLWMDEGLAEYFELPRGKHGFHRQHVFHLASKVQTDDWKPDLKRLEALSDANEMTQLDYAESWLWMHYLLETKESRRKLVQDQLARLRMMGDAEPLSNHIKRSEPDIENQLLDHLTELANQL